MTDDQIDEAVDPTPTPESDEGMRILAASTSAWRQRSTGRLIVTTRVDVDRPSGTMEEIVAIEPVSGPAVDSSVFVGRLVRRSTKEMMPHYVVTYREESASAPYKVVVLLGIRESWSGAHESVISACAVVDEP